MKILNLETNNSSQVDYQIGHLIGSYLPFVILVLVFYFIYNRFKKRNQN